MLNKIIIAFVGALFSCSTHAFNPTYNLKPTITSIHDLKKDNPGLLWANSRSNSGSIFAVAGIRNQSLPFTEGVVNFNGQSQLSRMSLSYPYLKKDSQDIAKLIKKIDRMIGSTNLGPIIGEMKTSNYTPDSCLSDTRGYQSKFFDIHITNRIVKKEYTSKIKGECILSYEIKRNGEPYLGQPRAESIFKTMNSMHPFLTIDEIKDQGFVLTVAKEKADGIKIYQVADTQNPRSHERVYIYYDHQRNRINKVGVKKSKKIQNNVRFDSFFIPNSGLKSYSNEDKLNTIPWHATTDDFPTYGIVTKKALVQLGEYTYYELFDPNPDNTQNKYFMGLINGKLVNKRNVTIFNGAFPKKAIHGVKAILSVINQKDIIEIKKETLNDLDTFLSDGKQTTHTISIERNNRSIVFEFIRSNDKSIITYNLIQR